MVRAAVVLLAGSVLALDRPAGPKAYRSILGDPAMAWRRPKTPRSAAGPLAPGGAGPRMQLFFYNLCSKAGPANLSVVPAATDTCAAAAGLGMGEVTRVTAADCCAACLAEPWCLAWSEPAAGECSLKDNALPAPNASGGVRVFAPLQELPSPRYANCVVDGAQSVGPEANAARVPRGQDAEWFAVEKEHALAEDCQVGESFFWTVMSQNGNAPAALGTDQACRSECYHQGDAARPAGYPPAVNASAAEECPASAARGLGSFNNLPGNQPKVLVAYTDPNDPSLRGGFNFTFELDQDLALSEAAFPKSASLGVWEWWWDEAKQSGVVRVYQRVSERYSWICTYFGADAGRGVKANQAYDGRGMMTEVPTTPDFLVRFHLNITNAQIKGGGVGSWYAPNMEACWDQKTRKPCQPYGDTDSMVHQQVLLDYGGGDSCTPSNFIGCPRYHIWRNGSKVYRSDPAFPYDAYKQYCGPCTSCPEMEPGEPCCDPYSNSNGQSIYKIAPHPEWVHWGFPANATDGFVGQPKFHELNVGGLFTQIWFPCMTTEPIEIITVSIGPETGYGTGTHDTEFFVSEFDILVPEESIVV